MTLSPVVTHTAESIRAQGARAASSPFKTLTSNPTSSNGTPRPAPPPTAHAATLPATLDLAEQMNEEEKRKYVKGVAPTPRTVPRSRLF